MMQPERRDDARGAEALALRCLARRAWGEAELYRRLCEKFTEEAAAAAMAAVQGYLDDADFAAQRAAGLHARGKSRREIERQLRTLGLDEAAVDGALDGLAAEDEAVALRLVRKQYMEKLAAGKREQVMAALARRGFAHGDIVRAVRAAEAGDEGL